MSAKQSYGLGEVVGPLIEYPNSAFLPKVSIVIPTYNEELGLEKVLGDILAVLDNEYEVVVVNDGSTDRTYEVARNFHETKFTNGLRFHIINHEKNMGKGVAMMSGIDNANGEYVIFIDADNTYPVSSIPAIVDLLDRGHDMVIGSRLTGSAETIPRFNQMGNHIFNWIFKGVYKSKSSDPLSGLYGVKTSHLRNMDLISGGFQIETEITIKAAAMGLKIFNMPIHYDKRLGEAKLNPLKDGYRIFRALLGFMPLYSPHLLFTLPGILAMLIGAGITGLFLATWSQLNVFGYFSLGIHAFLLSNMLILAGVQLTIFGISTNLYTILHKFYNKSKIQMFHNTIRRLKIVGFIAMAAGLYGGAGIFLEWIKTGFGEIHLLVRTIITSTAMILGLQLMLSSVYLEIFSSEILRKMKREADDMEKSRKELLVKRFINILPSDKEAEDFVRSMGYSPKSQKS